MSSLSSKPPNDLAATSVIGNHGVTCNKLHEHPGGFMRKLLPMFAIAAFTGCATPPSNIKAAPSDGKQCTQADRDRLADITSRQQRTANKDAFGVFMIGVPLGGDETHEPEIARLKGRCGVK